MYYDMLLYCIVTPAIDTPIFVCKTHILPNLQVFERFVPQVTLESDGLIFNPTTFTQVSEYNYVMYARVHLRQHLYDSIFNTKPKVYSLFWPSIYTQTMKTHTQNGDL